MEVAYLNELQAAWFVVDAVAWDSITPDLLRRYNVVVVYRVLGEYAAGKQCGGGGAEWVLWG